MVLGVERYAAHVHVALSDSSNVTILSSDNGAASMHRRSKDTPEAAVPVVENNMVRAFLRATPTHVSMRHGVSQQACILST
jgi:hypothetical protein